MSEPAATGRDVVDQALFRNVVGHFMTGVTVITTADDERRYGVTASAVSSLSLDPPMLLVCLNRRLPTCETVGRVGAFAVNILDEGQGDLATQFATRQADKFQGARVIEGELGLPLLADALAHLECRVVEQVDAATHTVFIAEANTASARAGNPLAYFRGSFGRFEQALDEAVYTELRERVLDRKVSLGETLTVDGLAAEMDVGRAPVYHALQKLLAEGLLSANSGTGYQIVPLTVDIAWQAYDARAVIECGVVDQLNGRPGDEKVAALRSAAEATAPWIRDDRFVDFERYLATNTVFHEVVVGLGDNTTVLHSYRRLAMAGVMSRALRTAEGTDDRFIQDHLDLADAIEAGNLDEARRIILAHAELGKERVSIAIEAAGGQY